MTRTSALYEFGDFALDVGQQRLTRRNTGEAIPLTAKAFDTLLYLVEHAAQTLDRDVMLRAHLARRDRRGEQSQPDHLDVAAGTG